MQMGSLLDTTSLVERLKANIGPILDSYPIRLAYLYGSAAAGNSTPFSDVDIALVADRELVPRERLKLMLEIEVELADQCDIHDADVRIINDAPLVFRGRVACDGILLYARDEATRIEFETTTRDAYFDYLPVHRKLQEAFFADVRERGLHGQPR
jgi:predicted nucleotidyltransferase